ncbi:hypothetical protein C7S15_7049 [Burkholderia cepacia]|nr:hypothetical protein [Burkholderia cepacia]
MRPQRSLSGPVTIRQLALYGRTDGLKEAIRSKPAPPDEAIRPASRRAARCGLLLLPCQRQ